MIEVTCYLAKLFDRDPVTGEVLWFSGPPIDIPRPRMPQHSLEYVHFLAKKRKREREREETATEVVKGSENDEAMVVDLVDDSTPPAKVPRKTLMEMIDEFWDEIMVEKS